MEGPREGFPEKAPSELCGSSGGDGQAGTCVGGRGGFRLEERLGKGEVT